MSRSSSSSGSSSPSPQSSPKLLGSFDPFAVHPFTNYSGPSQHGRNSAHSNQVHVLPHPSTLNLDAPAPGAPYPSTSSHHHPYYRNTNGMVHHPTPVPAGYHCQASQTHSGSSPHTSSARPIFVPFRQETSSPDLSDVLRRKPMGF